MPRASGTDASLRKFEHLDRRVPKRYLTAMLVALLLVGMLPASAQGLYGPEAPRDVSYLRVINARSGEPVTPIVAGEEWQPLEFAEVSSYRQLPPGEHKVDLGGTELTLTLQPEGFTSLALLDDQLLAIADTPLRDISRGLLSLYNLSANQTLTLATADGTEVIAEVPPLEAAARTISEAEVQLVVTAEGDTVGALDSRLYRRGEAHGIIVLPEGADPRIVYARAAAER